MTAKQSEARLMRLLRTLGNFVEAERGSEQPDIADLSITLAAYAVMCGSLKADVEDVRRVLG